MDRSPASTEPGRSRLVTLATMVAFWGGLLAVTYLALAPVPPTAGFDLSDVVQHALAFAYLTVAMWCAYQRRLPLHRMAVILAGYGVGIEIVQLFVPNRHFGLLDLAADGAGIAIGAACVAAASKLLAQLGRHDTRSPA